MSYELRTPLTSIGGFAEMLAGGYAGELPPTATEYVTAILESVARLGALIDDVLDLTQSDSGSLLLAEDKVDLRKLCAEAAEASSASRPRAKGIDFAVEIETGAGTIAGDRAPPRQSLDNVLKNAFAYTDEGGRVLLHAGGAARRRRSPSPTTAAASPPPTRRASSTASTAPPSRAAPTRPRSASACRSPSSSSRPMAARSSWSRSRARAPPSPAPAAEAVMLPRRAARRPRVRPRLAPLLRAGDVVALFGELGAGKTTLARGILAGLGHDGRGRQPDLPDRHPL